MTQYDLLIGDPSYSSWSLRGWLAFSAFGIPTNSTITRFYEPGFHQDLAPFAPAKTVPVVRAADQSLWTDSLTIIEELASRHPEAGLLPADPVKRALARSLMAEMHSSFSALRTECPMNTRLAYEDVPISDALAADLARIDALWAVTEDSAGPWLCGDYSAADAFYAPVAARIAGYSLPVSETSKKYVEAHLTHLPFRQFRALGLTFPAQETYNRDYAVKAWPGPKPLVATATSHTNAVNETCPYSGKAVTDFLEMDGKVYGFCNPRCRDKTVNDPAAWPAFMALVG